jgi:ribosomal protein S27AE
MIRFKTCFKCEVEKPLDEFYKHAMMSDGHLNKCKQCAKKDVHQHRAKNLERVRQYDRERGKLAHRIAASADVTRAWRAEDKRRGYAHKAVAKALRHGTLLREPCCRCGNQKSLAHHEDYDKPLDVMWLCQSCHKQRHAEINKLLMEVT